MREHTIGHVQVISLEVTSPQDTEGKCQQVDRMLLSNSSPNSNVPSLPVHRMLKVFSPEDTKCGGGLASSPQETPWAGGGGGGGGGGVIV